MMLRPDNYDSTRNVHRITLYSTVSSQHQHASNLTARLYLHLDMNCFYAQVEQQCYKLYGMPVIVGGWRKENGVPRGIVATSSYEARAYGIKTGMSFYEATQCCPYVIPLQVHYEKYQAISKDIHRVLKTYAPEIEGYSMDEYFLNINHLLSKNRDELTAFATELKNALYRETHLICSLGIAYSKTYAKLASDLQKPNGLTLILDEEDAQQHLWPLSLKDVWGIGSRRYARLAEAGLHTIADAMNAGVSPFMKIFGTYFGRMLFETVTGKDCAKVIEAEHDPKQICYMHTFSDWSNQFERILGEIAKAIRQLCYRMRAYQKKAEHYAGYIRFQDEVHNGISFSFKTEGPTDLDSYVSPPCLEQAIPLLKNALAKGVRIRGVGLTTSDMNDGKQLELFFSEQDRHRSLHYAMDKVNNTYGFDTMMNASLKYAVQGKTHFLDRNES